MTRSITLFDDTTWIATGPEAEVADIWAGVIARGTESRLLAFDDATGGVVDLPLGAAEPPPRRRGRPSLGVKAREVTLLPRHWEWLSRQRGGASAALRRLVEEASRQGGDVARQARDAAYRFMQAMAGDLPGYEEALRALYAGDAAGFTARTEGWPEDVRRYARSLAAEGLAAEGTG